MECFLSEKKVEQALEKGSLADSSVGFFMYMVLRRFIISWLWSSDLGRPVCLIRGLAL
jgi:hypothetical protein